MKKTVFLIVACCMVLLGTSSCMYKQYESTLVTPERQMPGWREVFTDPYLQVLIDSALKNNADAQTAALSIQQAEVAYKTSRLGYLPTFNLVPTGGIRKDGSASPVYSYNLGISASWQLDVLGGLVTNNKRMKKASLQYQKDYEQGVQCQLISSVAQLYYGLLGLEKQLQIQREMEALYQKTYESILTLYEAGQYTSPAVLETKAQVEGIHATIADLQYQITETRHSLCRLMNEAPHDIRCGSLDGIGLPSIVDNGIAAEMLNNRPDVRAAERQMAIAFYNAKLKEGALYPNLTLSGSAGWMNPTHWFVEGIGSLTQPIFQGGRLRADLKIARLDQQKALVAFRNKVVLAAHEVSTAMNDCSLADQKKSLLHAQVVALTEAVDATQELMNNGGASYLEVLTSMKNLLAARNAEVQNQTTAAKSLVALYGALGGR